MKEQFHPSDTQLVNYGMGLGLEQDLSRHIEGCAQCKQRLEQLETERQVFEKDLDARQRLAEILEHQGQAAASGRPVVLRWLPVACALLILVIGLAFVFFKESAPDSMPRIKGAPGVQVYVKRGGRVLQADEAFRYRASDRIRLGVLAPRPVRVTVLALQPAGYTAVEGLVDIPVPAGEETVLPGSLSLDCASGSETLRLSIRDATSDAPPSMRKLVLRCEQP